MVFLSGKTVGLRCWGSIQQANPGLPGQPGRTEQSHMARRNYPLTKTRPKRKNLHRNSPSRPRSIQNRRLSRLKTSLHSAAVREQIRCKELSRAQTFLKFCVTSCDALKFAAVNR